MRSFVAICDSQHFSSSGIPSWLQRYNVLNAFSMENSFYFSSFLLTLIHFAYLHRALSNCSTRCNTLGWRYAFIIYLMDKHLRWGGRELEFGWDLKNLNRETIGCVYLVDCFFFHLNANFHKLMVFHQLSNIQHLFGVNFCAYKIPVFSFSFQIKFYSSNFISSYFIKSDDKLNATNAYASIEAQIAVCRANEIFSSVYESWYHWICISMHD